jgi:uncharacterized protein (TIGR02391 family)
VAAERYICERYTATPGERVVRHLHTHKTCYMSANDKKYPIESLLHPIILMHAYPKLLDGHLRSAVLDAFIAVFDLIREKSGVMLDGADLVGKVFSLKDPKLIFSDLDTESGQNDQKGFIQILQGAYLGIRNPKAHSLNTNLSFESAAQYLVFSSLLARRIEASKMGTYIRYDGLYISELKADGSNKCIRFYEDGSVIAISTKPINLDEVTKSEINELLKWMTIENFQDKDYPRGSYTIDKEKIELFTETKLGKVEYKGRILGEKIQLQAFSHINGHKATRVYNFRRG